MAKSWEVINYLRPKGGIIAVGEDYEGIDFVWAEPFTKAEYEAAFDLVDAAKAQKEADELAKKQTALAKLEALGLDIDDLKALGLG
jgi:hypothetical protein